MEIGDKAPDFVLNDQDGTPVRLADQLGQGPVVVYFYPKDGTPVCTLEACSFRDNAHRFDKYHAKVLGVSSDSEESHKHFAATNHLNFPLLSDAGGKLRELWDVPTTMGILPGRVTYVLDKDGVVREMFSAQLAAEQHVDKALEAAKKLDALSGE